MNSYSNILLVGKRRQHPLLYSAVNCTRRLSKVHFKAWPLGATAVNYPVHLKCCSTNSHQIQTEKEEQVRHQILLTFSSKMMQTETEYNFLVPQFPWRSEMGQSLMRGRTLKSSQFSPFQWLPLFRLLSCIPTLILCINLLCLLKQRTINLATYTNKIYSLQFGIWIS